MSDVFILKQMFPYEEKVDNVPEIKEHLKVLSLFMLCETCFVNKEATR